MEPLVGLALTFARSYGGQADDYEFTKLALLLLRHGGGKKLRIRN